jgi:hypothetical protein
VCVRESRKRYADKDTQEGGERRSQNALQLKRHSKRTSNPFLLSQPSPGNMEYQEEEERKREKKREKEEREG